MLQNPVNMFLLKNIKIRRLKSAKVHTTKEERKK